MKNVCFLLAALLLLGAGCGDGSGKKLRIGISIPAATHGWTGGVVWSAERAKKNLEAENPDLQVIVTSSANTADQVNRIENLIARNVDALVVLAQEPGPISDICAKAARQGIFLVVVSNPLDQPVQDVFVNGDNRSFGAAAAKAMGRILEGKGDILMMEGVPCPINTDRVESFRETLSKEFPGIRILESQAAWWNTEKGLSLMENYLQKYPKIDAVWAGDDDVLVGALKAYEESGRKDVKAMIGEKRSNAFWTEIPWSRRQSPTRPACSNAVSRRLLPDSGTERKRAKKKSSFHRRSLRMRMRKTTISPTRSIETASGAAPMKLQTAIPASMQFRLRRGGGHG